MAVGTEKGAYFSISIESAQKKLMKLIHSMRHYFHHEVGGGEPEYQCLDVSNFHCSLQTNHWIHFGCQY